MREISLEGNIDISLVARAHRDLHDIIPSRHFSSVHTPGYNIRYCNGSRVHMLTQEMSRLGSRQMTTNQSQVK